MSKILLENVRNQRESWLELKRNYLGSSDSPAIVGLDKYRSNFHVWAEKLGRLEEKETTPSMYFGTKLESWVASEAVDRLRDEGRTVELLDVNALYQHESCPFISATPDYLIKVDGELGILECKTTSHRNEARWLEGPPDYAHLQALHQLEVIDECKFAIVAGFVFAPAFFLYKVERSDQVQSALVNKLKEFWGYLESKTPPPIERFDSDVLKALYPHSDNREIELPEAVLPLIESYHEAYAQRKAAEMAEEHITSQLKAMLGTARRGTFGIHSVTWTEVISNRLDSERLKETHPDLYKQFLKQSSSRRFSVKTRG